LDLTDNQETISSEKRKNFY